MTMVRLSVLAVLAASSLLIPQAVQAQNNFGAPGNAQGQQQQQQQGGAKVDPMSVYIQAGVSPEQESRIRQLAKEFEDAQAVRVKLVQGYLERMHLLQQIPSPDQAEALALQDKINAASAEMATERLKLMLKIRYTLSPEQREKLIQIVQQQYPQYRSAQ